MTELKRCPHCGSKAVYVHSMAYDWAKCGNMNCHNTATISVRYWNTRPIEDELNARIAQLTAEIARLNAEHRWKSMDTAPKDGSFVLLLENKEVYKAAWQRNYGVVSSRHDVFTWCVDCSYQDEQGYFATIDNPEGWMPLPEPPESEG